MEDPRIEAYERRKSQANERQKRYYQANKVEICLGFQKKRDRLKVYDLNCGDLILFDAGKYHFRGEGGGAEYDENDEYEYEDDDDNDDDEGGGGGGGYDNDEEGGRGQVKDKAYHLQRHLQRVAEYDGPDKLELVEGEYVKHPRQEFLDERDGKKLQNPFGIIPRRQQLIEHRDNDDNNGNGNGNDDDDDDDADDIADANDDDDDDDANDDDDEVIKNLKIQLKEAKKYLQEAIDDQRNGINEGNGRKFDDPVQGHIKKIARKKAVIVAIENKINKHLNRSPDKIAKDDRRGERERKQAEKINIAAIPKNPETRRDINGRLMMWSCPDCKPNFRCEKHSDEKKYPPFSRIYCKMCVQDYIEPANVNIWITGIESIFRVIDSMGLKTLIEAFSRPKEFEKALNNLQKTNVSSDDGDDGFYKPSSIKSIMQNIVIMLDEWDELADELDVKHFEELKHMFDVNKALVSIEFKSKIVDPAKAYMGYSELMRLTEHFYPDPSCKQRILIQLYYEIPARDDFALNVVDSMEKPNVDLEQNFIIDMVKQNQLIVVLNQFKTSNRGKDGNEKRRTIFLSDELSKNIRTYIKKKAGRTVLFKKSEPYHILKSMRSNPMNIVGLSGNSLRHMRISEEYYFTKFKRPIDEVRYKTKLASQMMHKFETAGNYVRRLLVPRDKDHLGVPSRMVLPTNHKDYDPKNPSKNAEPIPDKRVPIVINEKERKEEAEKLVADYNQEKNQQSRLKALGQTEVDMGPRVRRIDRVQENQRKKEAKERGPSASVALRGSNL